MSTSRHLAAAALLVAVTVAGCKRREPDRAIGPAPDTAPPASARAIASAASSADPLAVGVSSNPLAMPLKHDGPAPAPPASVDPCALHEERGGLAMKSPHDGPRPAARNPLCMPLK